MRGLALATIALLGGLAIWLWGFDGSQAVMRFAVTAQHETQNAMAVSLRAIKTGQAGAVLGLWALCFSYGFVHAAGPGHGKLIIGGYGVGARVAARRLVGLAFASSLAQALSAVVVVYLALWILGWGRAEMTDLADKTMAPLSYALIASVGVWLVLRGLRKAWKTRAVAHHDHHHHAGGICDSCGHAHAPSPEQAASVSSFRDGLAVVVSIAIRPCTGAFIMGLGTAMFTALVALAAVSARESVLAQTASGPRAAWLIVSAEIIAGAMISLIAVQLMQSAL